MTDNAAGTLSKVIDRVPAGHRPPRISAPFLCYVRRSALRTACNTGRIGSLATAWV
jgi:hypothetical protein